MENRQLKADSSDEEEFLQKLYKKKNKPQEDEPNSRLSKNDKEKIMELIKDPGLKSMMLQEATSAANDAI